MDVLHWQDSKDYLKKIMSGHFCDTLKLRVAQMKGTTYTKIDVFVRPFFIPAMVVGAKEIDQCLEPI